MSEISTENPLRRLGCGALLFWAALCISCSGGGGAGGEFDSATINTNHPPRAFNVNATVVPSSELVLRVLDTTYDQDGDSLRIIYVSQPLHGVVTIEDNGTPEDFSDDYLLYVCDSSFIGTVQFQYTISDGRDGRATGVVEIVVGNEANNTPIAIDDVVATPVDTAVMIDVLGNDVDPDGDPLSIDSYAAAGAGAVTQDDNGTPADLTDDRLMYMPAPGFVGMDSFAYWASDGEYVTQAIVTVTVGPPPPLVNVCGVVMKGALRGALVQLFGIDDFGMPVGTAVAQAVTDNEGRWCADVPLPRKSLLVRASGGEFDDETDSANVTSSRRTISLASDEYLETVLPPLDDYASLNVFTNAILEKSRSAATGGGFLGLYATNREFYKLAFGWSSDLLSTRPSDAAALNPADPEDARVYGMALGGIANVVNDVAVRFAQSEMTYEMIRAIVIDLTDCVLDGHYFVGSTPTPVSFDLDGLPRLLPDDLDLNLAILRFRNNNLSVFGSTPLAQIDGAVCLGDTGAVDTIAPVFVPDPLPDLFVRATGPLTNLLSVVPVPLASDNIDPDPDVIAIAIETDAGVPIPLTAPDVPPGAYDISWRASDSAVIPNTTERVQRVVIVANATGTVDLSPASLIPGTGISVTVIDADLNIDPDGFDNTIVTVRNNATLEVETVGLTETGMSTGVFGATLPTVFGLSAGTDENGQMVVKAGDDLQGQYADALDISGNPATALDTALVTGGFDGTIVMTPVSIIPGDTLTITVTDADLDTNPAVAETVDVTVTDSVE
ncbi:MAG: Ig-like domain-containing protein, partial [Gammaproteobacteria bacterium]|nr:Ig-like domain-containing protein [Gammaproteobacteria bacterium]